MTRKPANDPAMPATVRKIRAAVYTRKLSEEQLDMKFNSLDAQRDACGAYITSQRSEGWALVADRYDDGGVLGGTLTRANRTRCQTPSLLRGLIFGSDGRAKSPTYARGRRGRADHRAHFRRRDRGCGHRVGPGSAAPAGGGAGRLARGAGPWRLT